MHTKKLFFAALLMLSALSVFAQNNTVVFEGKSLALTYENLSALIKAGEKTQAVAVLKAKPELATSLKLAQVEALGWESFVEVGAKTFRRASVFRGTTSLSFYAVVSLSPITGLLAGEDTCKSG